MTEPGNERAELAGDPEIARRYRALAREEPPRALDEAVLAAARRELETRPAPLVAPTARRHWYVPLAAAAVIVLSVVVTVHMQREQPDAEMVAPAPAEPRTGPASAPPPAALEHDAAEKPLALPPKAEVRRAAPEPPAAAAPAAPLAAPALERQAAARPAAGATAKRAQEAESPERWLERIAQLRREGRHKEADESYAEFKRRYPDYRIPESMLERVAPR